MFQVRLPKSVHDFSTLADAEKFQLENGGELVVVEIPDPPTENPPSAVLTEEKLGEFRCALFLAYQPAVELFNSFPPNIQHGLSSEIYKELDKIPWDVVALIWNMGVAHPASRRVKVNDEMVPLTQEEIGTMNSIAELNCVPVRWLPDASIEVKD